MVVFSGKQVFPVDYEANVSQRFLEASLDGGLKSALQYVVDPCIDVGFVDVVSLRTRKTTVVPRVNSPRQA